MTGWVSLVFLLLSMVGNFTAATCIGKLKEGSHARRLAVAGAIAINLVPLFAFKIVQQWSAAGDGPATALIGSAMPLGLGFYTLQQITFLVDIQRPGAPRLGFARYAAWISFFGQLPAGPIASYARMAPQYLRLGLERVPPATVARGLTLILAGIVKKVWLADPMARKVDAVFLGVTVGGITPLEAWTAAWGFLLQLYFDFSAYSDIAIGVGLCFGLVLPINFNSPLKATTPGQYIMRWHISLMMFVRDYVFHPLFRVARRLPIQRTSRRYAVAWALSTLGAYLVVVAWHTLAPAALLQGLVVTMLILGVQFVRQTRHEPPATASVGLRKLAETGGHIAMLLAASVVALGLRAGSEGHFVTILTALFDVTSTDTLVRQGFRHRITFAAGGSSSALALFPDARLPGLQTLAMITATSVIALLAPNTMEIFGITGARPAPGILRWRPSVFWGGVTILLLLVAVMGMTRPVQQYAFIYARY